MMSVFGTGRWSSFLAWYFAKIKNIPVTQVGRSEDSKSYQGLLKSRKNEYLALPDNVTLSCDAEAAIASSKYLVISIHSQHLRAFLETLKGYDLSDKGILLCMKGIEISSGKRLSEVVEDVLPGVKTGIMVGPGHVQEITRGVQTCMVIDSKNKEYKEELVELVNSKLIRTYIGGDLIGNELGAAMKNVIGIVAGIIDALDLKQLKGPLMSRACYEVGKIIVAEGGAFFTAYGLSHLGDYEATLFSENSNNRRFGEAFARGEAIAHHAEGVETCKAAMSIIKKHGISAPITEQCYKVLYENADINDAINALFMRDIKHEFLIDPEKYLI